MEEETRVLADLMKPDSTNVMFLQMTFGEKKNKNIKHV